MSITSACQRHGSIILTLLNYLGCLGNQSEKSEICQSILERVSGEPSHGLGLVFPILRTCISVVSEIHAV